MAIIGGPLLLAAGCLAVVLRPSGDSSYHTHRTAQTVIDACQDDVRDGLRDPGSAQFSGWKAWEVTNPKKAPSGMMLDRAAGDAVWSATGLVNAKNGFGGYAGDHGYTCDAVVTKSGRVTVHTTDISGLLNSP